jgi:hypothetical protein
MRQLTDTGTSTVLARWTVAITGAGALMLATACSAAPARTGSAAVSSTPPSASTTAALSARPLVRDVLDGDGIGQARFGQPPGTVESELDPLLGQPTKPYYPATACTIDHAIEWPALIVFFFRSQLVGYTYGPPRLAGRPVLATARGLRVGDTLSYGQRLYGQAFHMAVEQGGVWSAATAHGQIDGFTSGNPQNGTNVGPRSVVLTIEAGKVGCPAMTP